MSNFIIDINLKSFHSEIDTSPSYNVNSNGDEIYKKSSTNHEMYRYHPEDGPIYAKKKNGDYYYARDSSGVEQYGVDNNINLDKNNWFLDVPIINDSDNPVYRKDLNGNEKYCFNYKQNIEYYSSDENEKEIYSNPPYFIKDHLGNELYALDENLNQYYFGTEVAKYADGLPFYAQNEQGQFYPLNYNNKEIYAKEEYEQDELIIVEELYARNLTDDEFYAKDEHSEPYFATHTNNGTIEQIYAKSYDLDEIYFDQNPTFAKNKLGLFYYASSKEKSQIYPQRNRDEFVMYQITTNLPVYAKNEQNSEFYPRNAAGDQFYSYKNPTKKQFVVYAVDSQNNKFYCKNRHNDEYYPDNLLDEVNIIVRNYKYIYAKNRNGFVLYPKDQSGQEYYFGGENSYSHIENEKIINYVKKNNKYIYPTKLELKTNGVIEMVMDKYILDHNKEIQYPRDEYNNEYTPLGIENSIGLPLTIDGFEIILEDDYSFISDLLYRSYKPEWDYLTTSQRLRRPVADEKRFITPYVTKPFVSKSTTKSSPSLKNPNQTVIPKPSVNKSVVGNLNQSINRQKLLSGKVWTFIIVILFIIGIILLKQI